MNLLLLSNSTNHGRRRFEHVQDELSSFYGQLDVLFVPYALTALRVAAERGARYGGASAGTNLACPTVRTTNDMPIVQPNGFAALGLIDFQINPHYLDTPPESTHMGETRAERIAEFLEENDVPVLGLREGAWLRVDGAVTVLHGRDAVLFRRGRETEELTVGTDVALVLGECRTRFDAPG
jgi:dipeptidase E